MPYKVEIIGDSISAGQFGSYEGISSWAYSFAAGLGNAEYSITVRQPGFSSRQPDPKLLISLRPTPESASMTRLAGLINVGW